MNEMISQEQIQQLQSVFEHFDKNNDGYLNEDELSNLLLEFEVDRTFAPFMLRIFSRANKNQIEINENDGITFDNFISFFIIMLSGNKKEFINLIFSAIDFDRNGKVGVNELIEFSKLIGDSMTTEQAKAMIQDCIEKQKSQRIVYCNDNLNEGSNKFKAENIESQIEFNFDQLWLRFT